MITTAGVTLFYLVSVFLIRRILKNRSPALSTGEIALFFAFKVLLGCLYGYIFLKYYGGDDTWNFHLSSLDEHRKLVHDPLAFFRDFSPAGPFRDAGNFWEGIQSYRTALEYWVTVKLLGFFDLFSRDNYYINVVFFNFLVFWGHYWLYALLQRQFPEKRKVLLAGIFLFPPIVFWLSGIRADGLIFGLLALLFSQFYRWMKNGKRSALFLCGLAAGGIVIFRSPLLLLALPALLGWYLTVRRRRRPWPAFFTVYAGCGILFFASVLLPGNGLPGTVIRRQQSFMELHGNTRYALDSLSPSFTGFIKVLPQAAGNTFLRPWPWEAKGMLQLLSALETGFLCVLLAAALVWPDPRRREYLSRPLLVTFLFFSCTLYVFIGYSIPFPGAIVRYKSIGEMLLLITVLINLKTDCRLLRARESGPAVVHASREESDTKSP